MMVDITYQMVLSTLQTLSLMIGIAYYILVLHNQQKNQKLTLETRQTGIFTQLAFNLYSLENMRIYYEVNEWEWNGTQDFFEKYGRGEARAKRMTVFLWFDMVGKLMKDGIIDSSLVSLLMGSAMVLTWKRFESIIAYERKRRGPSWVMFWEYTVQEVLKIDDQELISLYESS